MKDFLDALERCIATMYSLAEQIDEKNGPNDPYASLMVREDIEILEAGLTSLRLQCPPEPPKIILVMPVSCPECGGSGIAPHTEAMDDCKRCNGTGRVK